LTEEKKKYDEKTLHEKGVAEEVSRRVEGLRLVIAKKAGEGDVLYGSVTPADIADALAERGVEVDRRRIEVAEPIKRLGEHTVHVRFHRDVVAELTIEVQSLTPAAV
jgi:large subunit ribosomal protein L9